MKLYTITRENGEVQTANSMSEALKIARQMLAGESREIPGGGFRFSSRIYRGAEYRTDRPSERGDEREYVDAMDIWAFRSDATQESGVQAPVVISWCSA